MHMIEKNNKIFNKLIKNKPLNSNIKTKNINENKIDIKIIKEIPHHELFHFKPTDFKDFYKKKLQKAKDDYINLKKLNETENMEFETCGILLKNEERFYLTDFNFSREIYFGKEYNEPLFSGKLILCGVKQDDENYNLLKYKYSLKKEILINNKELNVEFDILILKGNFNSFEEYKNLADVFIFIGPFNENKNNFILEDFKNCIENIKKISLSFNKKIIILPSLNDLPPFNIFPQSKFNIKNTQLIIFGSNPFEFSINGINFCYINNSELDSLQKNHIFINENINKEFKLNSIMNEVFSNQSCINIFEWGINYSVPEYLIHSGDAEFYLTTSNIKTSIYKNSFNKHIINLNKNSKEELIILKIKSKKGITEVIKYRK